MEESIRSVLFTGDISLSKDRKFFLISIIIVLGLGLLVNSASGLERGRKPSADWGRGIPIGSDASGTVGMVVDAESTTVRAVWPFEAEDGVVGIRYIQLGRDAQVDVDTVVIKRQGQLRSSRLFVANDGLLHLLWANRIDATEKWQLWYAQIDYDGSLQGELIRISDADSGVFRYAVAETQNGDIWITWEDIRSGGINLTGISAFGEKQAQITRVAAVGSKPDIVVDDEGRIHLVWLDEENNLFYALSDGNSSSEFSKEKIFYIPLSTGASLDGPVLGVSGKTVYVFWSILNQAGLEAGTARTEYIAFPIDEPEKVSELSQIGVSPLEEQPYQADEGSYLYSQLVPSAAVHRTSDFVYAPSVIQNPRDELALAFSAQQEYRLDGYIQIAVAIMEDGQYKGYTFATKTQAISNDPVLATDGVGNLHLIWREGFSKKDVYYATTDTEIQAIADRITLRDVSSFILSGGMEGIAGILLFPLAFPWIFPGLVVVIIWRLAKNDENVSDSASQIILAISILLYQGSKVLVFPTIVNYVPFSAWIDIPVPWQFPLRIIIPLLILGISIGFMEKLRKRGKDSPSTLRYYFIVVLLDMLLTLAIYGVNFLGAY